MFVVFALVWALVLSKLTTTIVVFLEEDTQKYFCIANSLCKISGFSSIITALIIDFIIVLTMCVVLLVYTVKKCELICDTYKLDIMCNVLKHAYVIWLFLLVPFGLTIDAIVKNADIPTKILIVYYIQITAFGIVFIVNICAYVFKYKEYYSDDPEAMNLRSKCVI